MKLSYDAETDALDLRFSDAAVARTEEVRPDLLLDLDSEGRILASGLLEVSRRLDAKAVANLKAAR